MNVSDAKTMTNEWFAQSPQKNESPYEVGFYFSKFLNFLNFKFNGEPESFFSYLETKKDE